MYFAKRFFSLCFVALILFTSANLFSEGQKESKQKTITISGCAGTELNIVKELMPLFEAETGIKVVVEDTPWPQLFDKMSLEIATETGRYSVMLLPTQWIPEFSRFLEPIDTSKISLEDDFIPVLVDAYKNKGIQYGVPYYQMVQLGYYRTDLFEQAGVTIPQTWDEYITVLQKVKKSAGDEILAPGMLPFKRATHTACQFEEFLWSFGGDVWDTKGNATVNTPAGKKALQFMYDQYYKWNLLPPGSFELSWAEGGELFAQGRLATTWDFNRRIAILNNPETSKVIGKWDAFESPGVPLIGPWGFTIPKAAESKEEGYRLIQWLSDPANLRKQAVKGVATARESVYSYPDVLENTPQMPIILASSKKARYEDWPSAEPVWQVLIVGVTEALSNQKSIDQALADMNSEIQKIFDSN